MSHANAKPSDGRHLLDDDSLDTSPVVANASMNRDRGVAGLNSYARELGFSPLEFLEACARQRGSAAWLDLCCGTGRALIEAAQHLDAVLDPSATELVGVDLIPMFWPVPPDVPDVRLIAASLARCEPGRTFDLITCVHGLHYVGDKLGLIGRAVSWLVPDGRFAAHLDMANVRLADGRPAAWHVSRAMGRAGLRYDRRRRLVSCEGRRPLSFPMVYAGADDSAGPNFTCQPAVDSWYARSK